MLPDGAHVLIRSYGLAAVYTFPGFQRLGSFALPAQRQGEGVSVGVGGRILLSSEGVHAPVLQVSLPADLRAAVTGQTPSPTPTTTPSPATSTPAPQASGRPSSTGGGSSPTWLLWSVPGVILLGALGIGLGLRRRGLSEAGAERGIRAHPGALSGGSVHAGLRNDVRQHPARSSEPYVKPPLAGAWRAPNPRSAG